jgi:hypothetical protein
MVQLIRIALAGTGAIFSLGSAYVNPVLNEKRSQHLTPGIGERLQ